MGVTVDLIPLLLEEPPDRAVARIYGDGVAIRFDAETEEVTLEPSDVGAPLPRRTSGGRRNSRTRPSGYCNQYGCAAVRQLLPLNLTLEEMVASKEDWGKPAAWAITQNEKLWSAFDSVADRSVIVEWSLGDTYRTRLMESGDRTLFWVVGKNGGIARMGFVLSVRQTPKGYWKDALGTRHESPYSGRFFLPPFPNRRYIHRAALAKKPELAKCELLTTAAQAAPPLRIETKEWKAIERLLIQFDRTSLDFRSPWPSG